MDEWTEYIQDMADEYGVDYETAFVIFDMLGPSEAYDGFITMLEDAAEGY